jgi:hypothetical protein
MTVEEPVMEMPPQPTLRLHFGRRTTKRLAACDLTGGPSGVMHEPNWPDAKSPVCCQTGLW